MPFKVKGIDKLFYTEETAKRVARERRIRMPKIIPIKFKQIK